MTEPPVRRLRWSRAHRIIPTRYPPIPLFERIADPSDWEALAEIESLTNDRIRDELGEISLVPPDQRASGPGASWVMASFTHVGHPSRFSAGGFGVYYCAPTLAVAVAETSFHMARFYAATSAPPLDIDMRVLAGRVDNTFHDLRGGHAKFAGYHDPDDYGAAQALGHHLRERGSNGIAYDSVRHPGGQCLGALRPRAVGRPDVVGHLLYHWDGERVARYFDYERDDWVGIR